MKYLKFIAVIPIAVFIYLRLSSAFELLFDAPLFIAFPISLALAWAYCFCHILLQKRDSVYNYAVGIAAAALLHNFIIKDFFVNYNSFYYVTAVVGAGLLFGAYMCVFGIKCRGELRSPVWFKFEPIGLYLFVMLAALLNIVAVAYMNNSSIIYFWDNVGYWDRSVELAAALSKDVFAALGDVVQSIGVDDYNKVAALPFAIIALIFGESRLTFVLGIVNLCVLPSVIVLYQIARELCDMYADEDNFLQKYKPYFLCGVTVLAFPMLLYLALLGFVDAGGVLIILVIIKLYIRGRYDYAWLIVLLMLYRRWYAFFALSFLAAGAIVAIARRRDIASMLLLPLRVGLLLLFFFQSFVTNILLRNYAADYSVYSLGMDLDILLFTRYFGLAAILFAVVAIVYMIKDRLAQTLMLQLILCFAAFTYVQTHGQQHLLMYLPSLAILLMLALIRCRNIGVYVCAAVFAAAITVNAYVDKPQPENILNLQNLSPIPAFSITPPTRPDTDSLLALGAYLDGLCARDKKRACIIASSFVLNESILKHVEPSLNLPRKNRDYIAFLPSSWSEGETMSLYYVDYIVVCSPAQTHLPNQYIFSTIAESFISGRDISNAFTQIAAFTLADDVTAAVYKKHRGISGAEQSAFEQRLAQAKP